MRYIQANVSNIIPQAEENKALRSELDHILDIHSQQAGDMDQRVSFSCCPGFDC